MQSYKVGGCVRDKLMGVEPKDFDYVITGATPTFLEANGFKRVGESFPVFLHPETGDEWALARIETSTGLGYNDFNCKWQDVTIEDDLGRRDLTINSIACHVNTGELTDPYFGVEDIEAKMLRHTTEAFADDPVRVLRLARFSARFGPEWKIAPETKAMCQQMVASGMLKGLTAERVWKELEKALGEKHPRLFFDVLRELDALEVVFPDIFKLTTAKENLKWHPEGNAYEHTMLVLTQAAVHAPLIDFHALGFTEVEFKLAALLHDIGKGVTPYELMQYGKHHGHEVTGARMVPTFCEAYSVPAAMRKRLVKVTRYHMHMHKLKELNPKTFVRMMDDLDVMRDNVVVPLLFWLSVCDARGRLGGENDEVEESRLPLFLIERNFKSVKFADVFPDEAPKNGNVIKQKMYMARIAEMKKVKEEF